MLRLTCSALFASVILVIGCGEEQDPDPTESSAAHHYSLAEVEAALDSTRLNVVRDREAIIATEVEPRPRDSVRFATQGGHEFEVLIFATVNDALQAADDVAATELVSDGGSYVTAGNVIAAFPPGDYTAYRIAQRTIGDLAAEVREPADA